ncbi:hypothetical protein FPN187_contig00073-0002 [Flavobacterium psychrophilum]|nr:hypothetical protein FPN186_contig00089-0002 [Flavobacterium psychrophilum]GEJ34517.1 hypothetical protein FPN181_contig00109-0002 [Flavobacterium psychrophilum]GEJ35239.1 hypothetical protein FPN185_contig00122-0002 [Flavobacterium psychrophilum]GEJ39980.1 hypothetical protein FPN187_contig00073-0002 [Flavobacterium psychrophilum]GEJ52554.1 hypothetical protein FPKKO176_contig00077-0002 [Flavobacterium psychrophilum]
MQQAHTFGAIANLVVNSRLRFARNIILVENNKFRSSQLTPSVGTLGDSLPKNRKKTTIY